MLCKGQSVLPMGLMDEPKGGPVKMYCPKCRDVYNCAPECTNIDGACFGPTFPGLFFMSYEDLVPEQTSEVYVPKVFGFKIHNSSKINQSNNSKRGRREDSSSNATTHEEIGIDQSRSNPSAVGGASSGNKIIELREWNSNSG